MSRWELKYVLIGYVQHLGWGAQLNWRQGGEHLKLPLTIYLVTLWFVYNRRVWCTTHVTWLPNILYAHQIIWAQIEWTIEQIDRWIDIFSIHKEANADPWYLSTKVFLMCELIQGNRFKESLITLNWEMPKNTLE